MSSKVLFGDEAQKKVMAGIDLMAEAVGTTLGPRGRNVGIAIPNPQGEIIENRVVHDGVTVAKAILPKDPFEKFGADLLRQAAQKQVDSVGDGTTVVTLLTRAILKEALKIVAAGVNPMSLRAGLEKGRDLILAELDKLATPVKTLQQKIEVATVSAEDPELGKLIGETLHKVGVDGVVTVEESKSQDTVVEHQEGMQFDKGFISPYFINNPARMEASIEDTYILLADQNVVNIGELVPLLEEIAKKGAPRLVVIAPDVTDSALESLLINKLKGTWQTLCVQAPGLTSKQKEILQDIAILTGGKVISGDAGQAYENVTLDDLGRAKWVTSTKDATLIVGGQGVKKNIKDRVKALRAELDEEDSEFEREKLKERIAKLSDGVAVIKVGGHTEVEMGERKERALDAVAATKAAIEEGIVPGGETALLRVAPLASDILSNALREPFKKLLTNAGLSSEVLMEKIHNSPPDYGVDVTTGEVKDLIKAGIIDPVKVPKEAVRNAVSVATQVMSMGAVIVPIQEPKK